MWFASLLFNTFLVVGGLLLLRLIYVKLNSWGHLEMRQDEEESVAYPSSPFLRKNRKRSVERDPSERWNTRSPEAKKAIYNANYIASILTDNSSILTPTVARKVARSYVYLVKERFVQDLPLEEIPKGLSAEANTHLSFRKFRDLFLKRLAQSFSREIATDPGSRAIVKTVELCQKCFAKYPGFRHLVWISRPPQDVSRELQERATFEKMQKYLRTRNAEVKTKRAG